MREIKFRGFSKSLNNFIYGALIDFSDQDCLNLSAFFRRELNGDIEIETIGQFTGLKDKNNVEIYEGDILYHSLQGNRLVQYGSPFKNYGGYMLVSKNKMRGTLNDTDKLYKVIGNIYENPELLDLNEI